MRKSEFIQIEKQKNIKVHKALYNSMDGSFAEALQAWYINLYLE